MTDKKDERPKVKSISLGLLPDDDPIYGKPPKSTFRGFLPDDDPIYESGWNFIMGKHLNSNLKPKEEDE